MELTPGERGLLGQLRLLNEAAGREQAMRALTASWPPVHYDSYRNAYAGLVKKGLVEDRNQTFRITDAGLRAIGAAPVAAVPAAPKPAPRPIRQSAPAAKPPASAISRLFKGLLGRRR